MQNQDTNNQKKGEVGEDVKGNPQDKENNEATREGMHQIIEYDQMNQMGRAASNNIGSVSKRSDNWEMDQQPHGMEHMLSDENTNACVLM